MKNNTGWIKLHRSCLDHWLYKEYRPLTKREAWETILFTVNYEDGKSLIKGQLYDCLRGQSLLSLNSWAEKFVWSIKQVRTFFNLLEKDGMIFIEGLQYTTRLTVCNYDTYQDSGHTEGTPRAHRGHTEGTPRATIKEYKEIKEEKEYNRGENQRIFTPPTLDDVKRYCLERKNDVNPNTFVNFYTAKNWMIGKNKMKDWKAAIRTWEEKNKSPSFGCNKGMPMARPANPNDLLK